MTTISADVEEFIRLHRPHGQLEGDASEPTLTGYLVTVTCPCGVVFSRHATPGIAVLLRQAVQLFKTEADMKKSDKNVTTRKKGKDLGVKDAAKIVGGGITALESPTLKFAGRGYNEMIMVTRKVRSSNTSTPWRPVGQGRGDVMHPPQAA